MNFWISSLSFFAEVASFQLSIVFCVFTLIRVLNLYYTLLYLFIWITLCGVLLSFCNNELATGFLWVTEVLVIFIFLLMLFYINNLGDRSRVKVDESFIYVCLISFFILVLPTSQRYAESFINFFTDLFWTDYYEAMYYLFINDFLGFFLSFYLLNCFILIIVGYILYVGSLVCVMLFSSIKKFKFSNINAFINVLLSSQFFLYSLFFRKQDLFDQNLFAAVLNKVLQTND